MLYTYNFPMVVGGHEFCQYGSMDLTDENLRLTLAVCSQMRNPMAQHKQFWEPLFEHGVLCLRLGMWYHVRGHYPSWEKYCMTSFSLMNVVQQRYHALVLQDVWRGFQELCLLNESEATARPRLSVSNRGVHRCNPVAEALCLLGWACIKCVYFVEHLAHNPVEKLEDWLGKPPRRHWDFFWLTRAHMLCLNYPGLINSIDCDIYGLESQVPLDYMNEGHLSFMHRNGLYLVRSQMSDQWTYGLDLMRLGVMCLNFPESVRAFELSRGDAREIGGPMNPLLRRLFFLMEAKMYVLTSENELECSFLNSLHNLFGFKLFENLLTREHHPETWRIYTEGKSLLRLGFLLRLLTHVPVQVCVDVLESVDSFDGMVRELALMIDFLSKGRNSGELEFVSFELKRLQVSTLTMESMSSFCMRQKHEHMKVYEHNDFCLYTRIVTIAPLWHMRPDKVSLPQHQVVVEQRPETEEALVCEFVDQLERDHPRPNHVVV